MCLTDPNAIDSSYDITSDDKPKGGRFSRKKKSGSKNKLSLNISATSSSSPNNGNRAQPKSSSPVEGSMNAVPAEVPKSHFSMEENKSSTYNMAGDNLQPSGMAGTSNSGTSPQSSEIFRSDEQTGTNNSTVKRSISRTMSESTASSAMGSDIYINSLENIPTTSSDSLLKTDKDFPVLNIQSDVKVKEALSREVGRNKVPEKSSREQWSVRVGDPSWDDDEGRYKYEIKLTRNDGAAERSDTFSSSSSFHDVTATRSLQDFVWLERALRAEYHGGLITPLLSLAIYFASANNFSGDDILDTGSRMSSPVDIPSGMSWDATKATSRSIKFLEKILDQNETVDNNILATWLSDVINGVRGDGEVSLRYKADILQSEALETFLFRHAEALNDVSPDQMGTNKKRASSLGGFALFSFIEDNVGDGCYNNDSMLSIGDVIKTPFAVFEACTGRSDDRKNSPKRRNRKVYSSGATGVPGLHSNSILSESDFDDSWLLTSTPNSLAHSELLEAERDFIASSIKTSSDGMAKMQSLVKHEEYVGKCWRNLATSLSGLFSVEKDIETAHIGDQIKSNKKKQPFRKLRKSAVNEVILGLADGKADRARPGLILLESMLNAYYSDLNSVVPSFKEFVDATRQLDELDETHLMKDGEPKSSSIDQLKAFVKNSYQQSNKTTSGYTMEDEVQTIGSLNTTQSKALHRRVLSNEKMLKQSITSLCRESALRRARMAWWYFKTEAKQAANVHATAVALRQALSIDADTALAMKERRYDEDETRDNTAEIDLVKRILDLGNKNFSLSYNESSNESNQASVSRQAALSLAIDQVGRWDADTAQTILLAAGVEDAEVTIDETSRELRHVRKYAISLRESVERCLEAVNALTAVWDSDNNVRISKARREFWVAMSTFFSGRVSKDLRNVRVLADVGIDTQDRGGWIGLKAGNDSPVSRNTNQFIHFH